MILSINLPSSFCTYGPEVSCDSIGIEILLQYPHILHNIMKCRNKFEVRMEVNLDELQPEKR
jgi:hypothetical protein